MQPKNFISGFIISTFCVCLLVGLPTGVFAENINIDEVLFENNSDNDPPWQSLEPRVEMSFDTTSKLLTVVLSNEASYSDSYGGTDAGHLLTGLGFNLLPGVSIEDTGPTGGRDSSIRLHAGSVIIDPDGTSGIALIQDDWGYANEAMGHFSNPAESTINTVLSSMKSDAAVTFDGKAASNKLMDSFDYGLQGLDTPGHSNKRSIKNALAFDLYLAGPAETEWSSLLAHIRANPVVVSYGSPKCSSVPEPATLAMCFALFGVILIFRLRRCRAE